MTGLSLDVLSAEGRVYTLRFGGEIHSNKMERMNDEIRDREQVVRGVKKSASPVIKGLEIYHNYVRPHMALDGRTPASIGGLRPWVG